MSEKKKMLHKRKIVDRDGECNNNKGPTSPQTKRRCSGKRMLDALESALTPKMLEPLKAQNEHAKTTRSGRVISRYSNTFTTKVKTFATDQSRPLNKRKVRKLLSLQNVNSRLRIVKCHESTSLAHSPIYNLITLIKNGLKNDQFQSQLNEKPSTETDPSQNANVMQLYDADLSPSDSSSNSNSVDQTIAADTAPDAIPLEAIDFEDDLTLHCIKRSTRTESIQVIDEVDLTESTEPSEQGDDTDDKSEQAERFFVAIQSTPEADSTSPVNYASNKKADSESIVVKSGSETANMENPISDCSITTSQPNTSSFNDKAFSDSTNDDCIITECSTVDSTDNWQHGQIVWAALYAYPFWPAIIFNCEEELTFQKDNMIHVKFLYDSGRRGWVNANKNILPFNGLAEFKDKCKVQQKKRNKAYKFNVSERWNVAVLEAGVMQCVKISNRIEFYDNILMDAIKGLETKLRSHFKIINRCDTPQTIDTAYSSMKQSVSPASLSPTLNDLDRNYDVDKNINHYLKSCELSQPEALPEDDFQIEEASLYARVTESPSSSAQIFCPLYKLISDKLRMNENDMYQSIISNENLFASNLSELWSLLKTSKQSTSKSTNSLVIRRSRAFSTDTALSSSTFSTPNQSARQRVVAEKKANEHRRSQAKLIPDILWQAVEKPSKEQIMLEKQRKAEEKLLGFFVKNHPANFILKGLPKDPVCQYCLKSDSVMKCAGKCSSYFHKECFDKHVTEVKYDEVLKQKLKKELKDIREEADIIEPISSIEENAFKLQCAYCTTIPFTLVCMVCSKSDGECIPCCEKNCGKAYHIECLKYWPQHKKTYASNQIKSLSCSRHVCHTCVSPDIRNMFHSTESDKKLIKCILCPGTYHRSSECIPAGSELLSESQLICPRHQLVKSSKHISIDYCLFCSNGGTLICCDACVYSFHLDCLNVPVGDHFICEECESGRRPLYGEIVWCKYARSPWWPAIIVPPPRIPENVRLRQSEPNTICVFFFGTHDFGWVTQKNIYLYLKGDGEWKNKNEKQGLKNAIDEAEHWMHRFNEILEKSGKANVRKNKPPPYKKVKTNRVVARFTDSEYIECKCRPDDPAPCTIESDCYNALTNFECDPELCPAKDKCQNQNFHRGEQFKFQVNMTESKGWGLFAHEDIPVDKFVIEYMGEVIDNIEFEQRFTRATANKDDNYYFLTLGNNLYIDAAIYGNEARFINHSCDPNVVPIKWTVYSNGQEQIRTGFFALRKILAGEEITFDYNWGTKNMKTVCQCGSKKCRGHI